MPARRARTAQIVSPGKRLVFDRSNRSLPDSLTLEESMGSSLEVFQPAPAEGN
jgi:hypothetical protein